MKKLTLLGFIIMFAAQSFAEEVKLTWTANPASENVIRYHIYRSEGLVSTTALPKDFRPVKMAENGLTSATDWVPDDGLTYTYVVRAFNGKVEGEASNQVIVTTTKAPSKTQGLARVK